MGLEDINEKIVLGRGKAGVILKDEDSVRKIYVGATLPDLIHRILSGGPLPYKYNRDKVYVALHSGLILSVLIPYWFVMPIPIGALYSLGTIDFTTSLALIPFDGSFLMTAYTGLRMGRAL